MKTVLVLLILFPLLGALYQIFFCRLLPRRLAEIVAATSLVASFFMAITAFYLPHGPGITTIRHWFGVADFSVSMNLHYDALAALMALMVTFVGSLITIYSISYMREDHDYRRYFCYMNLFVFFMLIIVLADNLVFLFLGWEGVGFCSYALIGFWYETPANATAGRKAFLLTRIGDVGFGIAIALFFVSCHSLSISVINAQASTLTAGTAMLLGFLLLWSATGKSAQLPLLVWLPDAMAGPTPVSALIHAATMVTAGVYLLIRLFPVIAMAPEVLRTIAAVGAFTAFYAACAALVQKDIKRVLAYSTISQVGYMFLAIGAGDIIGSMFHLLTHAFFKSLLFLAAGCIIHALNGERDIFHMGQAVRRRLPAVFLVFLAGSLALGGVPPSAGFYSKGRILLATLSHGGAFYSGLWTLATLTAFLTSLYTFRLFFIVFTGKPASRPEGDMSPVPKLMVWVLWPLAAFALLGGFLNLPQVHAGGGWLSHYMAMMPGAISAPAAGPALEWKVENADRLIAVAGLIFAYFLYGPKNILDWRRPEPFGRKWTGLLLSGFGLDRIYDTVFVRPYFSASRFIWHTIDEKGIDRGLVTGAGAFPLLAGVLRTWSTGLLSTSLKMLLLGFTIFLVSLTL